MRETKYDIQVYWSLSTLVVEQDDYKITGERYRRLSPLLYPPPADSERTTRKLKLFLDPVESRSYVRDGVPV